MISHASERKQWWNHPALVLYHEHISSSKNLTPQKVLQDQAFLLLWWIKLITISPLFIFSWKILVLVLNFPSYPALVFRNSIANLTFVYAIASSVELATLWKNMVFLSPSLSHKHLYFCLHEIPSTLPSCFRWSLRKFDLSVSEFERGLVSFSCSIWTSSSRALLLWVSIIP